MAKEWRWISIILLLPTFSYLPSSSNLPSLWCPTPAPTLIILYLYTHTHTPPYTLVHVGKGSYLIRGGGPCCHTQFPMPKRSSGQLNQTERHVRSRSPYEVEKRRSTTLSEDIIHAQDSKDGPLNSREPQFPVSEDAPDRSRSSLPSTDPRDIDKRASFEKHKWRQWRPKSPWACSVPLLAATGMAFILMLIIIHAFVTRQLDPKGCGMCWSRPIYFHFKDFDTEHTRFASKYSLYMIKEGGIDEDARVGPAFHRRENALTITGQRRSSPVHSR